MKEYETEEFKRSSEEAIQILAGLAKGEIGLQEAYDALVKNGDDPATIPSCMFEWLGGDDCVDSPEVEENNRKINERLSHLVRVPIVEPEFDYLQLRDWTEEEMAGDPGDPEDHIFPIFKKLVSGQVNGEEAIKSLVGEGAPEDESRKEVEIALAQMRAADGLPASTAAESV